MYLISNEKFGAFLMEIRKEKQLTQKELADKLFVSDKTVSKWERGLSMPNVALLIPIADVLSISVTELLKGEHLNPSEVPSDEDHSVSNIDAQSIHQSLQHKKRNWMIAYGICICISLFLLYLTWNAGLTIDEMKDTILTATLLMIVFGAWFTFFTKDLLPSYYDDNKINIITQGICRIHMVGITFNNNNWMYVCTTLKYWTLALAVGFPLCAYGVITFIDKNTWMSVQSPFFFICMIAMVISIYVVAKKHE